MPWDISNIFSKLSIKEIGEHLNNYSKLYTNPIESWKQAFSQRKSGFDFTIIQLIYYSLLVLLFLQDVYLTLQIVALDIILTFFPIIIFYIPFKIGSVIFKVHKNWKKLFRTFLIIKFQLTPLLIIIILVYKWAKWEPAFILIENGVWFIWLAFILVVPLIVNIKIWNRVIWIVLNYIFFLVNMSLFALFMNHIDSEELIIKRLTIKSPNNEYSSVWNKSRCQYRISDDDYIAVIRHVDSTLSVLESVQFASNNLALIIMKNSRDQDIKEMRLMDSILTLTNPTHIRRYSKHKVDSNLFFLNEAILDSFKTDLNKDFYSDLELYKNAKDSAIYKSNKDLYNLHYGYLTHYNELFVNDKKRKEIVSSNLYKFEFQLSHNKTVCLIRLDSTYIYPQKKTLIELNDKLLRRIEYANFMSNVMLYPVNLLDGLWIGD